MTGTLPDILVRIVSQKQAEAVSARASLADLERRAEAQRAARRDFRAALLRQPPSVIAEIKRASPSKGLFTKDFDPETIARAYQAGGAAAISVVTDPEFFQGRLSFLESARTTTTAPVLRKDFTIDEAQIVEAAAHGADAILLIAAILDEHRIRKFRETATAWGLAALVEVHDAEELRIALAAGADLVGVNNRDLRTFEVSLDTSLRIADRMPASVVKVSESGIHSYADVRRLMDAGFQAFLVGEHLMTSADPAAAVRALREAP